MEHILISTGFELKYENFISAENCALFDSDGNKYLDLESGVWCTSIGHCHPKITQTITEQSEKMIHTGYCYLNPVINAAAASILRITGINSGKCVFLCSGSEAVEYSIKMTKSFSNKPYFLTLKNSYLSAYGISGERSESNWIEFDWLNNQDINTIDFKKVSAFVFEPGSSLGLVHFPPKELIIKINQKVKENGGIVIANEVTTGIGRTGEWFGYNHYDFTPDIIAIGKGLGNGYPVSCVVISENVLNKLNLNDFHYAQSHQNDPLGAAVANTVIEIIENENLLQRSREIGEELYKGLSQINDRYGIIKEIRRRGMMFAIEFEKNENFSYADIINAELHKKNIILVKRPGVEVFRLDPALTISHEDIEYFIKSIEAIISGVVCR
ncbi:aspartate aminotransferase family protein [Anoxynatronum buryatiense]|uniref:Acetylornithine aminotransferase n=1 Tax=Anoxynatronum buryatiense TaxID=489973 RepID=A0AA45WVK6_9CLOT|nr:aspartate aminotransferase family protein [Anoxynatronum buryatiense]SMP53923.1 acetylornithine aminotransferase [Anoxynatronum buryatiense]